MLVLKTSIFRFKIKINILFILCICIYRLKPSIMRGFFFHESQNSFKFHIFVLKYNNLIVNTSCLFRCTCINRFNPSIVRFNFLITRLFLWAMTICVCTKWRKNCTQELQRWGSCQWTTHHKITLTKHFKNNLPLIV